MKRYQTFFYLVLTKYKDTVNKEIFVHTINFHKTTKRFERPLFLIADTTLR